MNIIIANTQEFNPQIGGVERVSTILAEQFVKLGHNVYFLACIRSTYSKDYTPVVPQTILSDSSQLDSSRNVNEFCAVLEKNNIEIIMNQAGNILNFSNLCFSAEDIYKKAKVFSVVHIDPICNLKMLSDFSFSILPSQNKWRVIIRIILSPYRLYKAYKKGKNVYNLVYSKSDKVVLLSNLFKRNFKLITNLKNYEKLEAISNPIPFCKSDINFSKEKSILYVGRIDWSQKRVDRLLSVWSKLYEDYPDWRLDIVGDGPMRDELIEVTKKHHLERVNFVGFVDPVEYYKKAQILCMTSTFEGFGMVLIEGANYGCIPMAFDSFASLHDIIEDGTNGYIIKPYDLKAYENKLRLMMDNVELREKLRNNALDISDKFQLENIANQWIRLFEECLT